MALINIPDGYNYVLICDWQLLDLNPILNSLVLILPHKNVCVEITFCKQVYEISCDRNIKRLPTLRS